MKFICAGGTIDSYYDTDLCTTLPHKSTAIPEYLKSTVTMDTKDIDFEEVCMKDSRQITEKDREAMVKILHESKETEFVITHGTYTLFETAIYVQKNLKRTDITVTLTGALIPLVGFAPTDAGFNIAGAILNSKLNKHGVYVYIKGEVYDPNHKVILHT